MSLFTTVNFATFGLGAVIGAAATAAVAHTRKAAEVVKPAVAAPVIEVDSKNRPRIVTDPSVPQHSGAVLKYGHPGMLCLLPSGSYLG